MVLKDTIRQSLNLSQQVQNSYLADLEDSDLLLAPVEGMNPIAWQIGHLIVSERGMLESVRPGASPELPAGFAEAHPRDPAGFDPSKALTKQGYLDVAAAQRAATLQLLEELSEDDMAKPAAEAMARMASSVAQVFNMMGLHVTMHVGQYVAVRRALKKPVAI